jgi:hypothetical protein
MLSVEAWKRRNVVTRGDAHEAHKQQPTSLPASVKVLEHLSLNGEALKS